MVCWSHFETLPSSDQTISLQTKLYFETTTGFETKAILSIHVLYGGHSHTAPNARKIREW